MRERWLRVTQMARWATTLLAARTSVATQVTVHDSIEPCPSCIPDARMWYGTQRPRLTCTRRKRLQRTPPSLAEPAGCILRVRSCPAQAQAMTSVIHQREHLTHLVQAEAICLTLLCEKLERCTLVFDDL